jgi:oxygen-dependent protoporphyrinogen oxidase
MSSPREQRVAVVGGGITGLAAAFTLQQKARRSGQPVSFALFESSPVLGGKIQTVEQDGFTVEGGPDSFIRDKPWAAQLAQELGLEDELMGTNPAQKQLYVVNRGRLERMPDGVMLVIPTRFMPFITSPLISWPGKIRMGLDFFIPRRSDDADESMGAFFRRRLGQEMLEKLAEPLLSGIHVSDPERQSILATFPRFRKMEKEHGSLIRGMLAGRRHPAPRPIPGAPAWKSSVFVTLREGLGELVAALGEALAPDQVRTNCRVTAVQADPHDGYRVVTTGGHAEHFDAVILTSPAYVSAELVSTLHPKLTQVLGEFGYVSTATVSLAYAGAAFPKPLSGVGFIIPRGEQRRITASTWTSNKFAHRAPEDRVLIRCFVGGPGREAAVDQSDEEMITAAHAELADLTGVQGRPLFGRVFRWVKGNPQYEVGHLERVARLRTLAAETPGLYLAGAAYDGVGVPDCVRQGQQAAEQALAYLQSVIPEVSHAATR